MKIAFDAKRLFFNNTGLGNYSRSLVKGLYEFAPQNEYVLCTPKKPIPTELKFFEQHFKMLSPSKKIQNVAWRSKGVVKDLRNNNIDIYHGLSHEIPIGIQNTNIKSVVTIHDLIYKFFPEDFPVLDRKIYDLKWKNACNNATHIIATSEATKRDIIKYFNIDSKKISVVYQTCDQIFEQPVSNEMLSVVKAKYNLPETFFLNVGALMKRKNVLSLVKAFHKIESKIDIPLIIVGRGKEYKHEIESYIHINSLSKKVIILDSVESHELPVLYTMAHTFVYPSKYEGFGIPIVESLKCGTQVLTSNCSCLPEVGGEAALYCDPYSIDSISDGLLQSFRTEISKYTVENQAKTFSTQRFATDTSNIYSNSI